MVIFTSQKYILGKSDAYLIYCSCRREAVSFLNFIIYSELDGLQNLGNRYTKTLSN